MNSDSVIERELLSGKSIMSGTFGDSMKPLLTQGETLVIISPTVNELKKNDLPLYRRPSGKFVMHRIIRVTDNSYYTRGDNRCESEKVPKEWVLGVVTEIRRNGKTIKVTCKKYKFYVFIWNTIYPIRRICYKIRGRLKRGK